MGRKHIFLVVVLFAALSAGAAVAAPRSFLPGDWRTWWGKIAIRNGTYTLESAAPSSPSETHSALLTSIPQFGDGTFALTTTTLRQLRTGSPPNPWEVGWAMFRFRDLENYYWFILKPNGWELGKKQGSDTQIFLATGGSPRLVVGKAAQFRIVMAGPRIRVSVDGAPVVDFVDPNPLPAGAVGLYEEDSRVRFESVSVTSS